MFFANFMFNLNRETSGSERIKLFYRDVHGCCMNQVDLNQGGEHFVKCRSICKVLTSCFVLLLISHAVIVKMFKRDFLVVMSLSKTCFDVFNGQLSVNDLNHHQLYPVMRQISKNCIPHWVVLY